jgi:hypothetical protein
MLKKFIVTTTINKPTKAIRKFDEMKGWSLIVSGDLKTPKSYKLKNGLYLSPSDQIKISKKLSDLIGWNCIQRRNFSMIMAYRLGADIVATIDDDNIPLENWGKNLLLEKHNNVKCYNVKFDAFDPLSVTNYQNLWHRGFPLQLLSTKNLKKKFLIKKIKPDIQADFWNGDPDIDAICRMQFKPECKFENKFFPFYSNKPSPFNSQNTFITRKVIKDYFLFPHTGRMDDIWASYYIYSLGYKVVYSRPSVYQKRNVHNLIKDMKQEYLGYENNLDLIKNLKKNPNSIIKFLPKKSNEAFVHYKKIISSFK